MDTVISLTVHQESSKIRLKDVAGAAGISVGMIQHHFRSRDELMDEASRRFLLDVVKDLERIAGEDASPWDKLIRLCRHVSSASDARSRVIVWMDLLSQATRNAARQSSTSSIQRAWTDLMAEVIEGGIRSGHFAPSATSNTVAQQLVIFVDGLDVAMASGAAGADPQWRDRHLLEMARLLLGAPDQPSRR